jgi:hypothetical protein
MTQFSRMLLAASLLLGFGGASHVRSAEELTLLTLEKPLPVDPKADEITRLLIQRRNTAVELLQSQYALFAGGRGNLDPVIGSANRAFTAQVEVPGSNRRQLLEQHLKFAIELDGVVNQRFENGVVDATSRLGAKLLRLEAELRLAREKQDGKKKTE